LYEASLWFGDGSEGVREAAGPEWSGLTCGQAAAFNPVTALSHDAQGVRWSSTVTRLPAMYHSRWLIDNGAAGAPDTSGSA